MSAKQLQPDSKLDEYDFDHDGIVTDAEIERAKEIREFEDQSRKHFCLLYTSPSPRDGLLSRMPSSA